MHYSLFVAEHDERDDPGSKLWSDEGSLQDDSRQSVCWNHARALVSNSSRVTGTYPHHIWPESLFLVNATSMYNSDLNHATPSTLAGAQVLPSSKASFNNANCGNLGGSSPETSASGERVQSEKVTFCVRDGETAEVAYMVCTLCLDSVRSCILAT